MRLLLISIFISTVSAVYSQGTGTGLPQAVNLPGRTLISLPDSAIDPGEGGKVVVNITVDSLGNVIEGSVPARGTTAIEKRLWEYSKRTALKAKFSIDLEKPKQIGTLTFLFIEK